MANSDRIDPNVPGLDAALAFKESRLPGNLQSGTAYTAELSDLERIIRFTGSGAAVLTIPANANCPFPFGTILTVARDGSGSVTISPAAGVTINKPGGVSTISAQYQTVSLRKTGTDTWFLSGSLG